MNSHNNKTFFNEMAKDWNKNLPLINSSIALQAIEEFQIGPGCSVLDCCIRYGFSDLNILDEYYFCFSARRK